ncbi:MAG: F0F1 ATP synthase subunit epsilon [Pseudomonadota bacterium]
MTLQLRHATGCEFFDKVTSFVGEDASGSFGILPGHGRMMTALGVGLARFRIGEIEWHYLALPGGILSGGGDRLTLCTRRYLHDTELRRMGTLLAELQRADQEALGGIRESLHRLEEEMLRRLREIERGSHE